MKKNTAIITGLFMLMILAFTVDPTFIYHFQNTLLGKAVVILVLIYLTTNNVTLGLLFALAIIIISSRVDVPMVEGLKNNKIKSKIKSIKKKDTQERCKTLEELLREERVKRMKKNKLGSIKKNAKNNNNNNVSASANTTTSNGVDRITVEETFRVRNPSTIPVTKEAFKVKELTPSDNTSKYYGGSCSLI